MFYKLVQHSVLAQLHFFSCRLTYFFLSKHALRVLAFSLVKIQELFLGTRHSRPVTKPFRCSALGYGFYFGRGVHISMRLEYKHARETRIVCRWEKPKGPKLIWGVLIAQYSVRIMKDWLGEWPNIKTRAGILFKEHSQWIWPIKLEVQKWLCRILTYRICIYTVPPQ